MIQQFNKIFRPNTVAAIGASDKKNSVGYALMRNLTKGGFKGKIYPVNKNHRKVQGQKAYRFVKELPEKVDVAIIATPARTIPSIMKACGQAGIQGAVIISAGLNEADEKGKAIFKEIIAIARQYNIRMIGPNCLGIINPSWGLNASFASKMPLPGKIALISQSGAICTSILDWSITQNVGFSHFVSVGAMADIDFADLIDYFGSDSETSCILIYMESLKNTRRFMSAARAFARYKPIIVLKAGKSTEGARAATSHTGALAGNDLVFDAAFKRAGILRVDRIAQLFHLAKAISMQRVPFGKRLAIVTNAGGPGVLATDYLINHGGELAKLSEEQILQLNEYLPTYWSHNNPIDILGDATAATYRQTLECIIKDTNVDGILTILTPQSMTDPKAIAEVLVAINEQTNKTMLASWMGEEQVGEGRDILEKGKVPDYRYPESAVSVFLNMAMYAQNIKLLYETPPMISKEIHPNKEAAAAFIRSIQAQGRSQLREFESKQLLSYYGIPVAPHKVASTVEEAISSAEEIGYPVVLKVVSPQITHKSDAGGIILNIQSAAEMASAYEQLLKNIAASSIHLRVQGVLVEKMINKKYELLIGAHKDAIFGPVIVFGRGGTETELYRDINMGLPPLNRVLAKHIIEGTKVHQLISSFRNMPPVNQEELELLLVQFAYLVMDFPQIANIDINPFLMDEHGGIAVDAHIELDNDALPTQGYKHLSIPPYPKAYTKTISLKNGQVATLRSIRPEDEPLEMELFNCLSEQSLYQRFFRFITKPSHSMLSRLTNIDYDREIAIVAEVEEAGKRKLVGVVRLVGDAWQERAEYAIIIADAWQKLGLGNQMTNFILDIAKKRQLKTIYADVLTFNTSMIRMFEKRGFELKAEDHEVRYVELDLEKWAVVDKEAPSLKINVTT